MKIFTLVMRVMTFFAIFLFLPRGECRGIPCVPAITVGVFKDYELIVPKEGYIGAPFSPCPMPNLRKPSGSSGFDTRFIRVVVIAVNENIELNRIVLRIDEIDSKGGTLDNGLYYAYLDVRPKGTSVICRISNDGDNVDESGYVAFGIPFPFACAFPPALGIEGMDKDGYATPAGRFVLTRKSENGKTSGISVEVTALALKTKSSADDDRSRTENVMNDSPAGVLYREEQKWDNVMDWLWDEMERVDKDGNILLRCKKR